MVLRLTLQDRRGDSLRVLAHERFLLLGALDRLQLHVAAFVVVRVDIDPTCILLLQRAKFAWVRAKTGTEFKERSQVRILGLSKAGEHSRVLRPGAHPRTPRFDHARSPR